MFERMYSPLPASPLALIDLRAGWSDSVHPR